MHSVVLCSDWSRDMYPENSGGKFTNLLHHNMNFSREDWSVALTDIVYTPDTWHNVRDGYNDVQIRMKGFYKWGLIPITMWGGEAPTYEIVGSKYRVTFGRRKGTTLDPHAAAKDISPRPVYFRSEWMPDTKPFHVDVKLVNTPIFKRQIALDGKWSFNPMNPWLKNDCNQFQLDMLNPGPVIHDVWEYETVYIPPKFYASFKEFRLAFNAAVVVGTLRIFYRTNAHPDTTTLPKYTMTEYKPYQMSIMEKYRALHRFHYVLDEYDTDMSDALKVLTGGSNNDLFGEIRKGTQMGEYSDLSVGFRTILDNRFEKVVKSNKWDDDIGEYITLMDVNNVWVTLTSYVKEGYSTIAALSISEAFAKATNFSMKINRFMQYQLGFTINSLFDMGWVSWYARKEKLETTKIPSLYWYGYDPHNLSNNPLKCMCVHCDIIEGSYVGKSQKPLLRVLPVNIISHIVSYESFAVLRYRHINKNNVSAITIWLTETPDGEPIDLRSSVPVKLQFVRNG